NIWLTLDKFPPLKCLSFGLSQGIVYQLCYEAIVKVPFQYPVSRTPPADETNEQIDMSFQSFALFKRESAFYTMLAKVPHANLPQRLQSKVISGIALPRFKSLKK
ncbi:hypothetical protein EJ02DRAFT_339046, partial [Clathrospora elynae]